MGTKIWIMWNFHKNVNFHNRQNTLLLFFSQQLKDVNSILSSFVVIQPLSHVHLFVSPWTSLHSRFPCPPPSPRVCPSSCPLSQWCYLTISSSAAPFSFGLPCFPASGAFPVSRLFVSGGQSIGVSASASVLPMNIQGWFHLGLSG